MSAVFFATNVGRNISLRVVGCYKTRSLGILGTVTNFISEAMRSCSFFIVRHVPPPEIHIHTTVYICRPPGVPKDILKRVRRQWPASHAPGMTYCGGVQGEGRVEQNSKREQSFTA